jgi:predicted Na+-dependent transporter
MYFPSWSCKKGLMDILSTQFLNFCNFTASTNLHNLVPINIFINRYLGLILLVSAILGLFLELPFINTSRIIIISLAGIIFASFFRIHLTAGIFIEDIKPIGFYYLIRFIIVPVIAFYVFIPFSLFYAPAFLLLLLLPTAVASPAFTAIFGGNIKLSLQLLVLTSFASIFAIPAITHIVIAQKVEIDSSEMLMTMVYTIVYPFIFHLPFRGSHGVRKIIYNNGPLITAIGLAIILIVSTSYNRAIILEHPGRMALYGVIAIIFYMICYTIGFSLMHRQSLEKRITYSISSGANNIGLGVALTALYFPGDTNVFFIVTQLAWMVMLIPMRYFYSVLPPKVKGLGS